MQSDTPTNDVQTASEYLVKTKSATQKLFEGIDEYISILRGKTATFVTSYSPDDPGAVDREWQKWISRNQALIQASLQAQRDYFAESFAQAALCGSILQIAAKAIECYSSNAVVPNDWSTFVSSKSKAAPFCIGRPVRTVPLGLVIYAGRNQHTHYEDPNLRDPNSEVFKRLAINHGHDKPGDPIRFDPCFQLDPALKNSLASNVTALIGWRTYNAYEEDMRELLLA